MNKLGEARDKFNEQAAAFDKQDGSIDKDDKDDPENDHDNSETEVKAIINEEEVSKEESPKKVSKDCKTVTIVEDKNVPGMVPDHSDSPDSHSEEVVTPAFLASLTKDMTTTTLQIEKTVTTAEKNITPASASPPASRYRLALKRL